MYARSDALLATADLVRADRKSSFLIRDILPDADVAGAFCRPLTCSETANGLDLLRVGGAWDCRLFAALNPTTDQSLIVPGRSAVGRTISSCGAVCCVMCSGSGWPNGTGALTDILAHPCVLSNNGSSASNVGTSVAFSWNCLNSSSLPVFSSEPSSTDFSSSPHMSLPGDDRSLSTTKEHIHNSNVGGGASAVPRKVRRNRTVFTELQLMGLERRFDSQKYLSTPDRADLARTLGLTQLQVKTWYQNRRMKWKKQVMQGGCTVPPTKPKGRPKKNSIPSLNECDAKSSFLGGIISPNKSNIVPTNYSTSITDGIL